LPDCPDQAPNRNSNIHAVMNCRPRPEGYPVWDLKRIVENIFDMKYVVGMS
jgi:hypothetical protein